MDAGSDSQQDIFELSMSLTTPKGAANNKPGFGARPVQPFTFLDGLQGFGRGYQFRTPAWTCSRTAGGLTATYLSLDQM